MAVATAVTLVAVGRELFIAAYILYDKYSAKEAADITQKCDQIITIMQQMSDCIKANQDTSLSSLCGQLSAFDSSLPESFENFLKENNQAKLRTAVKNTAENIRHTDLSSLSAASRTTISNDIEMVIGSLKAIKILMQSKQSSDRAYLNSAFFVLSSTINISPDRIDTLFESAPDIQGQVSRIYNNLNSSIHEYSDNTLDVIDDIGAYITTKSSNLSNQISSVIDSASSNIESVLSASGEAIGDGTSAITEKVRGVIIYVMSKLSNPFKR